MTLSSGSRLGPYEIVAPLGAGGMGEVYRAKDSRLGRDVAIKVLPADVSSDPERLRRFEQEARAASALSHPNILTVFELGTHEGHPFLVTELLEGRSLRELIASGETIGAKRALAWGTQVARGLAAAHDKGIVHRDLKPENLFLTRDGVVKILDFGLAKLTAPDDRALAAATTIAGAATGSGVILGTAGYMAPEQVRGAGVDARADLFALGCVLYELLGGQRAFRGDTSIETLNAILKEEPPPLAGLRAAISPAVSRIVERCLEKDPAERFQSARDLAFNLESLTAESGQGTLPAGLRPARSPALSRRLAGLLLLVTALAGGALLGRYGSPSRSAPPVRIRYLTSSGHDTAPAISPDGRTLAFASNRDGTQKIWLKQLATGGEAPLTEGRDWAPRFFPDGESILFTRQDGAHLALYRTALVGGQPRRLLDDARDGEISPDGRQIGFIRPSIEGGETVTTLMLAAADGSGVRELLRAGAGNVLHQPRFSPDGRILAVNRGGEGGSRAEIRLVDTDGRLLKSIPALLSNAAISNVAWLRGGKSFLYMQASSTAGTVAASEGRLTRYELSSGRSTTLLWSPVSGGWIDIAGPGRILFDGTPPRENLHLVVFPSESAGEDKRWLSRGLAIDRQPTFSPDEKRIIFSSSRSGNLDIWELELATGASRPLTEDPGDDWDPSLSPDGKRLLWSSNRGGSFEIWTADADGSHPRQVTHDGDAENPMETPDGQWIVYVSGFPAHSGIWKMRPDGSQATRLVAGNPINPELSPDGELVAYRINYTSPVAKVRVVRVADGSPVPFELEARNDSGQAGRTRWFPDGKRLAFVATDPQGAVGVFVQDFIPGVDTSATRRRLGGFDPESPAESFAISPDGNSMVYASLERLWSVLLAEDVPGVDPPERQRP